MKLFFEESFHKDLLSVTDTKIKKTVSRIINELEQSKSLNDIRSIKKIKNSKSAYRIRLGDYRIGLVSYHESVVLVRILRRDKIYRFFP